MLTTRYHPSAYATASPVASLWATDMTPPRYAALQQDHHCDIAVIGAGYTGLSAAYHLSLAQTANVCVLEAAQPGWGASGRNGGFCCLGSTKLSYSQLIRRFGLNATRHFLTVQQEAVALVQTLAEREHLPIAAVGTGEFILAHKPARAHRLRAEQTFLQETLGLPATYHAGSELAALGLGGAFHAALHYPVGFGLHPLRYVSGLAAAAVRHGAQLYGDSPVHAWTRHGHQHVLHTPGGTVTAERVIVAGNGYTPEHLHPALYGSTLPALSNIITTRPLTEAEQAAQGWQTLTPACDSRVLLHYFRRLPDGRFLFGGRGGLSASPAAARALQARLTHTFRQLFPAWRAVEITHFWRGLVCLAADRLPHIGPLPADPTVLVGMAYHGSGVAMATWAGQALARLCQGETDTQVLPIILRQPLPHFPLPVLRLFYLRAAYAGYHVQDEWL